MKQNNIQSFECVDCNKDYEKHLDWELAGSFQNTQKFCDENSTTFVWYFGKVFIHITTWIVGKIFNETFFPDKKKCYGNPIMENITDTDNKYAKRVREDFLIQNLGKYRDLYAQNDTLLLADLFESSPASA